MPPRSSDAIALELAHEHREVDLERLRDRVRRVLAGENARLVALSVVLAGHETVRRLNRDYLDHDYDTDVLSFSLRETLPAAEDAAEDRGEEEPVQDATTDAPGERTGPPAFPSPEENAAGEGAPADGEGPVVEGEVYVDLDTAAERHQEFDASFEEEVHRYVVHGVLHLCGYDDATESGAAEMRRRENRYLADA